jgi:hypothetical protein
MAGGHESGDENREAESDVYHVVHRAMVRDSLA